MPSVKSSSIAVVEDSSTVMTPSLPTLSNASAIRPPISASCAEMVATFAISSLPSTSRATSSRRSFTASTAASMPRFRADGAAPAATLRRPSLTMACASTVAVVVPSPATSLVLVATSLASWAPRFSYGSSSSISLAIVTPSLVMVGAPHFLSMTTLRPFGPRVTLTVSASRSTPRCSESRASEWNCKILDMTSLHTPKPRHRRRRGEGIELLVDDREDVAGRQDEVLLGAQLDLGAAVLREDDGVAFLDVHRRALAVLEAAGADREDLALLRLLLRGVRNHDAGRRRLLGLQHLNDDAVLERLDVDLGGRGHDLTSPTLRVVDGCLRRRRRTAVAGVGPAHPPQSGWHSGVLRDWPSGEPSANLRRRPAGRQSGSVGRPSDRRTGTSPWSSARLRGCSRRRSRCPPGRARRPCPRRHAGHHRRSRRGRSPPCPGPPSPSRPCSCRRP